MRRKNKLLGEAKAKLTDKFEWYVHLPKKTCQNNEKDLKSFSYKIVSDKCMISNKDLSEINESTY